MYLWIWRRLPGDARTKALVAALALAAAGLLLWYVVFPWLEPKTQFDHSVIGGDPSPTATRGR
ncbi:hypothetical protein [Actinomadura atramentaria]|uniref:hypothetical protein n=1 Tax=Actinomadura atramentaria TaxID=1990 RepID=UPI00036ADDF7|nr:hypothetical protein [Actinomadura atramentaria]